MKYTRVYADADGESRFDDVEVTLDANHPLAGHDLIFELVDGGEIGHLSLPVPARSVMFRRNDPGYDYDWHCAPRRQFIILLDGAIEIEVSTGEKRVLKGGEILLVEDTWGRGHRTRHVQPVERHSVFIVLDDDAKE